MKLEELAAGSIVRGLVTGADVKVESVTWHGSEAVTLVYRNLSDNRLGEQLLYRHDEARLSLAQRERLWSFDADGAIFRLVAEAYRIRQAHLFDPMMAVHTSSIDPLPHQISAVYERMLPMQPLRFLLADDPGAGKTIMAGLYIRELMLRGELERCLIVCPGILVEQWQDELNRRFDLHFEIFTTESMDSSVTGNWFAERPLILARLDKLSRNKELQKKLEHPDCWWDLVVVDEAHKLSAHYFGNELKKTKRYELGELLARQTRNFLLLTATPHNGKEEDFQLFMALLDGDRFEGRFRDSTHAVNVSDLMRRAVKEDLVRFDGSRLFPERYAVTIPFELSDLEQRLYHDVTEYVNTEFNRAEENKLEPGRKQNVGFALTILQRRLASSPEAILKSLERRRERLERNLQEIRMGGTGESSRPAPRYSWLPDPDDLDDLEDLPEEEWEEYSREMVSALTAAANPRELEAEIATLKKLEEQARAVRRSGRDAKWQQLSEVLHYLFQPRNGAAESVTRHTEGIPEPPRDPKEKLVIFTEHRDTLNYLKERCDNLFGNDPDAVLTIHGSMGREERQKIQERFLNDFRARLLIATDAAGEGINLQRAHLMVNYDLPWNPNRIEQRFGRIHRIGQTRPCYLWNFVAHETREGYVYYRLLKKLEEARKALGGKVFDVLGKLEFEDRPFRDLLIEAIRHGDQHEALGRLERVIDQSVDPEQLRRLLDTQALSKEILDSARICRIREEMERAEARRLQPHHVESWFMEAFRRLGGSIHPREPRRWEITNVPSAIRHRDRQIGRAEPVLSRYDRVTFHREATHPPGKPQAAFITPGHPLFEATQDLILERYRELFRHGAALVDPNDPGVAPRLLFLVEYAIRDQLTQPRTGEPRVIFQDIAFLERRADGSWTRAQAAPYLDYRPLKPDTDPPLETLLARPECAWLKRMAEAGPDRLEGEAIQYCIMNMVGPRLERVRTERLDYIRKVRAAVRERLLAEIQYWDHRAAELQAREAANHPNLRFNSAQADRRAKELTDRLDRRMADLDRQENISASDPVLVTAALVLPAGLLARAADAGAETPDTARDTQDAAARARRAVMRIERSLGFKPADRELDRLGYDIESRDPNTGSLRFIEVKGRIAGADTVTFTRNEVITALNRPDSWILALVHWENGASGTVYYIRQPFGKEPDFGVATLDYKVSELLQREKEVYAIPTETD